MKEGWEYKKLGELSSFIGDGDWIESKDQSTNGIRLIQTGNIGNGVYKSKEDKPHYISERTFEDLGCTEIFEGDCLVSRLPDPVGRACLIPKLPFRAITAVDCTIIRFNERVLSKYFVYYTQSTPYSKRVYLRTTGSTRKRISRKNLEAIEIPLPPLTEQQSIVAELDKINEIIDLKKAQLKDLDLLAQSIFYDMFGDPIENSKGWEVKKLGEVCKLSQGLAINKQTKHYLSDIPTSIPLLRIKDMKDGTREIFVKEDDCPTSCMAYPDDIIYTRTGTLGLAFTNMYGIMHNNCFKIVTNEELVKVFFMNYIQGEWFKSNIIRLASRSSQPDITHKLFLSQSIIVPPLSLQQSFASKIQAIESQKASIKQSLAEVETLLASRMDYWFN